jgi:hypothetical protein
VRTSICLLSLCFFTLTLQGQQRPPQPKVAVTTIGLVSVPEILYKLNVQGPKTARLYRRPNTRVKKALSFVPFGNRPQVA